MKRSLIAFGVLAAMAAPASADEVEDSINLALQAYRSGDIAAAKEEVDFVAQLLAQQQASALSKLLPAPFDGWSREESDNAGYGAGMFGGGLTAGATYERDDDTVELQLMGDSPMMTGMMAMFSSPAIASSMGTLKRINGHKTIVTHDGELQSVIANRFLVQVSGSASVEDKEAYFTAIDFDALEAF